MPASSTTFLAVLTTFMAFAPLHSSAIAGERSAACDTPAVAQPAERDPDAGALRDSLARDGTVRLYTISFTENGAAILPESRPTIDAIATLLRDQPNLQLFIVGHTDSAGPLPQNLKLSRAWADAVVLALTSEHHITVERLDPHGVGPLTPIASNDSEQGRRLNRRLEIVAR